MIVSESDTLLAALDRRLQVGRVEALDVLAPLADREGSAAGAAPSASVTSPSPASSAAAASFPEEAALLERLPLGQIVAARVVAVPGTRQVIADFGSLRIALAWPGGALVPQAGDTLALRVLAHEPMLLFEDAHAAASPARNDDATTRLSTSALRLQSSPGTPGPIRFTIPMLIAAPAASGAAPIDGADTRSPAAAPTMAGAVSIALDDVIVGTGADLVERSAVVDANANPALVMPLVLHGPAWAGQDVELVVRRERADEAFENAALDQWCGELVVDLPHLGRVAGHLAWSMQGLRIRLEGQDAESVASMTGASAELAAGLAEVELPVLSLSVGQLFSDTALGLPQGWRDE